MVELRWVESAVRDLEKICDYKAMHKYLQDESLIQSKQRQHSLTLVGLYLR
jgi:hypothetical protein